jgi:hypothetical protein
LCSRPRSSARGRARARRGSVGSPCGARCSRCARPSTLTATTAPHRTRALRRRCAPLRRAAYFVAFLGGPLALGPSRWRSPSSSARRAVVVRCSRARTFSSSETTANCCGGRRRGRRSARTRSARGRWSRPAGSASASRRLSTRYAAFSLYLLVALVYLLPCVVEDAARRGYVTGRELALLKRLGALWPSSRARTRLNLRARRTARREPTGGARVSARRRACSSSKSRRRSGAWPKGYTPTCACCASGPSRSTEWATCARRSSGAVACAHSRRRGRLLRRYGSFERLGARRRVRRGGYARLPRVGGEPADAVVLARTGRTKTTRRCSRWPMGASRAHGRPALAKDFSAGRAPDSPRLEITAWAFDAEEGKAYRLCGTHAAASAALISVSVGTEGCRSRFEIDLCVCLCFDPYGREHQRLLPRVTTTRRASPVWSETRSPCCPR